MRTYPSTLTPKLLVPALTLALFGSASSLANDHSGLTGFQDTARVVASTPIYESVNQPRRECWNERVTYESRQYERASDRGVGAAILGGVVGGVLGNSIGKGDGRKAATAAGVALGAIVGDRYGDERGGYQTVEPRTRIEQQCRMVDNWSRKLSGYDVTYRYQGREYTTFMPYDPGHSVRVNVSVTLAER
jgi:uncharacterized protein YcfJ